MKLYVGNLPYQATESDLENWFSQAGISVDSVNVMRDRFSGEARGFGFVEIGNEQDAARAVSSCNGKDFMGRALVVNGRQCRPSMWCGKLANILFWQRPAGIGCRLSPKVCLPKLANILPFGRRTFADNPTALTGPRRQRTFPAPLRKRGPRRQDDNRRFHPRVAGLRRRLPI